MLKNCGGSRFRKGSQFIEDVLFFPGGSDFEEFRERFQPSAGEVEFDAEFRGGFPEGLGLVCGGQGYDFGQLGLFERRKRLQCLALVRNTQRKSVWNLTG